MSDMNRACIVGRLTKDPEIRMTQNGHTVCNFTVAVNRPKKKDEEESTADFISCVAWNSSANYIERYGHKGDRISVDGQIQTRNYQNDHGMTVYVTEIKADNVALLQDRERTTTYTYSEPRMGERIDREQIFRQSEEEKKKDGENTDDLPF